MNRLLLRALNGPMLVLLAALGVAVQTSLFYSPPLRYLQPDVILWLVFWCAVQRPFGEGGVLTLILAEIAELHSAAPQGTYLIAYMGVFLAMRAAHRAVVLSGIRAYAGATFLSALFARGMLVGTLALLGDAQAYVSHALRWSVLEALITSGLSVWVYRWLEKLDWLTYKHKKAELALPDELQGDLKSELDDRELWHS